MSRKVKSVRVPRELEALDLTGLVRECERYLRDLESAGMLKSKGDERAAKSLLSARQADLGRKVARLVLKARVEFGRAASEAEGI